MSDSEVDPPRVRGGGALPAGIVSLVLHGFVAVVGAIAVARGIGRTEPPQPEPDHSFPTPATDEPIIVELPTSEGTDEQAEPAAPITPPPPNAPELAGGAKVAMIDDEKAGKGGDSMVTTTAKNLSPRPEQDTVASALRDDVVRDQENHLDASKDRKTEVDRREAVEPMELTFVSSGKGFRFERHPSAVSDAAAGSSMAPATVLGQTLGAAGTPKDGEGEKQKSPGGETLGGKIAAKTPGADYGTSIGSMQLAGASVVKARPDVDKGKPSVMANDKGAAADNGNADQANAALKSLVDTSTFGGGKTGEGVGGAGGGGDPGAGGTSGGGSKTVALGDGPGALDALREARRLAFFHQLQKRLEPIVRETFPKEEELDLRSGTVIVDLTIAKTGNVVDVVVIRPSGFGIFDKNVVFAIRAAGLLEPVPDQLSMGAVTIRVPVQGGWRLH